jgi:hypothetical protein
MDRRLTGYLMQVVDASHEVVEDERKRIRLVDLVRESKITVEDCNSMQKHLLKSLE